MTEREIFVAAIELDDADQRAALLNEACGSDQQLRERVELLLRGYEKVGSFLDLPAGEEWATIDMPLIGEGPGSVIGPYKLLQQIGEGGFGVVFMADQTEPVKRRVALKIIKPGMDSRQVIARFEAERQALALMDHPNIARVFDAGTTESGRPYFVMELVRGVPITRYCDEKQLTPKERLGLFMPVCQALQHAHQRGVIHRDIKPSNVLVAEYDDQAVPKIIDFGVAKATQQQLTEKTMFTQFGQVVGTFEYMSPEQAKLNQLDIDTRSDVYSLGVLLYELLTGETPVDRAQLHSAAFDEVLRIIREEEPRKPSLRLSASESLPSIARNRRMEPRKLSTLVRGELDWIVMKALEKDRTRRYQTANGFANDIQRYLNEEPVNACPPSNLYRLRKFVRRNRVATIGTTSVVVALLLAVAGIFIGLWRAQLAEKTAAELARRQAYEYGTILAFEAWNGGDRNRLSDLLQAQVPRPNENDLRGFESRCLQSLYQDFRETQRFTMSSLVDSVAYSNDGRYFAIASKNVVIQDRRTREKTELPVGFNANHIAFSRSGSYLLASRSDRQAGAFCVWSLPSKEKCAKDFENLSLLSLEWCPDESLLAGVRPDGRVEMRRFPTGEVSWTSDVGHTILSYDHQIQLTFSPDGTILASGGDRMVRLWNSKTGDLIVSVDIGLVGELFFSSDGNALFTVSERETKMWTVTPSSLDETGFSIRDHAMSGAISPDGSILALGCSDHCVRMYELESQTLIARLLHSAYPRAIDFAPDGRELAAGGRDGQVLLWTDNHWDHRRARDRCRSAKHWMPPLAVSHSGSVAVCENANDGYRLKLWEPETGVQTVLLSVETHNEYRFPPAVAFSPDGETLAFGADDGIIRLWSMQENRVIREFKADRGQIHSMAFSPDGSMLACGGYEIHVFDSATGRPRPLEIGPGDRTDVTSVTFSRQGLLAAGGGEWYHHGDTRLWDFSDGTGKLLGATTHPDIARCVAFSPDGSQFAVTHNFDAGIFAIFDVASLDLVLEFQGHASKSMAIMFTPDGQRLITGSDDGSLGFWDATNGVPLGSLELGERTRSLAMRPDGNAFLSASQEGWVRLWRAANLTD